MMEAIHGAAPQAVRAVFGADPLIWNVLSQDAGVAMAVCDAEGTFITVSEALAKQMGTTPAQLIGKRLGEVFHPEYADERRLFIRQAIRTGQPIVVEEICRGLHRLTTLRPLPLDNDGRQRILMVCKAASSTTAIERPADAIRAKNDDLGGLQALTHRELEILTLIGDGLSTADIADRLHRSVKTVEWHRVSLGNKLGVTNRVELARIAIRAGLTMLDSPKKPEPAAV